MESNRNTAHEPHSEQQGSVKKLGHRAPEASSDTSSLENMESIHGVAFSAYLSHVGNEITADYAEEDFNSTYRGSYGSVEGFAEDYTESLGWNSALEYFTYVEGIPSGLVSWNMPALLQMLHSEYQIVEYGGSIHVFYK